MKKPLQIKSISDDLNERYIENLKRKEPMSKQNIAELVYGRILIEKQQATLN